MLDIQNLKEPVYAEYLPKAKENLKDTIVSLIPTIQNEPDRVKQFELLIENFGDLSIVVTKKPLIREPVPSLKFGLDENETEGEKGFTLQFSTDEARNINAGMEPSLYAALCEEGLLRTIKIYEELLLKIRTCERETKQDDEFPNAYAKELDTLYALLEFVQTAPNPFDVAEKITMFPFRY